MPGNPRQPPGMEKKPANTGMTYLSSAGGFLPSTVSIVKIYSYSTKSWPIQPHQVGDTRPEQKPDEEVFQQRQRWEVGDVWRGCGVEVVWRLGPGEEVLQQPGEQ